MQYAYMQYAIDLYAIDLNAIDLPYDEQEIKIILTRSNVFLQKKNEPTR